MEESSNIGEDHQDYGWSLFGFEAFDLTAMLAQVIIYLASFSLDSLFSNPIFRFIIGIGFFVAIFYLSRTKTYARGVKQI